MSTAASGGASGTATDRSEPVSGPGGSRNRRRRLAKCRLLMRAVLAVGLTILAGWADPFGLQAATDRYSNSVLNLLRGPSYPDRARDAVTVVINTDRTLDTLGTHWPVPYGDHARLLRTILRHQPQALFIDYVFLDDRSGEDVARLRDVLTGANVPIYYAASPAKTQQTLPTKWHTAAPAAPLTPVSIPRGRAAKARDTYDLVGQPPSPALALFRAHCRDSQDCSVPSEGRFDRPMDVIWGSDPPTYPGGGAEARSDGFIPCREGVPKGLIDRVWRMLTDGPAALRRDCPFIETLPAQVLAQRPWAEEVQQLLKDRLVLYGGSFHGAADLVDSPTHGRIPGVHLHAMALHNLLLWGDRYVSPAHAVQSTAITPARIEAGTTTLIYGVFTGFLLAWIGPVYRQARRRGGPALAQRTPRSGVVVRALVHIAAALFALLVVLGVLIGVLWSQWYWLRLSPINWLGITGLFVAFLGLFTPYIDRLPGLDLASADAEKRRGRNAR